jgi:predicted transcriptional regulator
MATQLQIPDDLAHRLREKAAATGTDPQSVAVSAIRRHLMADDDVDSIFAPVREAFRASRVSEDDAVELFEDEKHALRRERKSNAS